MTSKSELSRVLTKYAKNYIKIIFQMRCFCLQFVFLSFYFEVVTPPPVCKVEVESVFSVTGFMTFTVVAATAISNIISNGKFHTHYFGRIHERCHSSKGDGVSTCVKLYIKCKLNMHFSVTERAGWKLWVKFVHKLACMLRLIR